MENSPYSQETQPSTYQPQYNVPKKEMLPGSITTLILGIVSLANMAFFGWIPALIAYRFYRKSREAMETEPGRYSPTSLNMANSGKKMADIGLILGFLGMIVTFIYYYWIISQAMSGYGMYDHDYGYDAFD